MKYSRILFYIALPLLVLCALLPQSARAESILFSTTVPGHLYAKFNSGAWFGFPGIAFIRTLSNPNFSISYNVKVSNIDSGSIIRCGDNVPKGSKVRFEFMPHQYSDIYWFGTGTVSDSPYGDWNVNAVRNSGGMCVDKNYYFTEIGMPNGTMHYADFSVNPPEKTIMGLPPSSCVNAGTQSDCEFTQPTDITAQFNFRPTFGKFYYGFARRVINAGICNVIADPLYRGSGGISERNLTNQFQLTIPEQSLNCPIRVIDPTGNVPNAPTITGGANCKAGIPTVFTMTATDPDTDPEQSSIRYVIDWNDDGKADQVVPSTGYVPSGTSQTVSRTWTTPGVKTFKVLAQDKEGLTSAWKSHSTGDCLASDVPLDDDFENLTYGDYPDGTLTLEADRTLTNTTCKINWNAGYVADCGLYKNNELLESVPFSGEMDVTPGTYRFSCRELNSGAILSKEVRCIKNIDTREI